MATEPPVQPTKVVRCRCGDSMTGHHLVNGEWKCGWCAAEARREEARMKKRRYEITVIVAVGGGTDAQIVPWLQEHVRRNAFAQSKDVEVEAVDVHAQGVA